MTILRLAAAAALLLIFQASAFAQTTLRIGLAEDPDILDPTMARTYVGRIVFSAICDKLFDIDEKLNIVPQLALSQETSADGGLSPALEKLVAAFSRTAEGRGSSGVGMEGASPGA